MRKSNGIRNEEEKEQNSIRDEVLWVESLKIKCGSPHKVVHTMPDT